MLPPIPNNSRFIDKFPDQGLSKENEQDKRKQEAYAAEVAVYRALESLKEEVVVLHGLSYTNRQYALFNQDFKYDHEEPNKEAAECDFVILGKNYVVIIEVSDVRIDHSQTTKERITEAFDRKKERANRTKDLIKKALLDTNPEENVKKHPPIKWFCAFLSLSKATDLKLQDNQLSNIIFKDWFTDRQGVFQSWWNETILGQFDKLTDEKMIANMKYILIGLWNINPQNESNPGENCSLGSCIMRADRQLREAEITYSFGKQNSGYINPNFVVADQVFRNMGIKYLSREQESVFRNEDNFLWINGPAGSGKTMLILGKAIEIAKTDQSKVVIFKSMIEERSKKVYQQSFTDAGICFESIQTNIMNVNLNSVTAYDEIIQDLATEIIACFQSKMIKVVLVQFNFNTPKSRQYCHTNMSLGGLQVCHKIIQLVIATEQISFFSIDDEQCLLQDRSYDRTEKVKEFQDLAANIQNGRIWICSDIAQAPNLMAPYNSDNLTTAVDSMIQVYGKLTLTRNLRNTCYISNALATIRERIFLSPTEDSGHYLKGPRPLIRVLQTFGDMQSMVITCRTWIKKELEKVMDYTWMKASDIALICNTSDINTIILKEFNEFSVCNVLDTYSAEWPVVMLLMDLNGMTDKDYIILHQLYLGLSRARVYCSALLYSPNKDTGTIRNFAAILQSLEPHADIQFLTGLTVNKKDSDEFISLHEAVKENLPGTVRFLVEAGADVHMKDSRGCTPLHNAVLKGNIEIVGYLVEAGLDVNTMDIERFTPLHDAVWQNNFVMVSYLVEVGANVTSKNSSGLTPLRYAVQQYNLKMARYLVEAGANVNTKDRRKHTPLHDAVLNYNLEMARWLVEAGADLNTKNSRGIAPLHEAVLEDKIEMARNLVEAGADVNTKDNSGYTPLHNAVLKDNIEMAGFLVAAGADVNMRESCGFTPLQYSVQQNNLNMARYLVVKAGANVNTKDRRQLTPLHDAILNHNLEIARYLVEAGADVNTKNSSGFTPLQDAVQQNNVNMARYLVEAGADVNMNDSKGYTPLHNAVLKDNIEMVEYLVEAGADVNMKDSRGYTPLHNAVLKDNIEMVGFLVAAGADVNMRESCGFTPLQYSVQQNNLNMARYLVVKAGANVNTKDRRQLTPLHDAILNHNLEIARYLVEAGADVNTKNSSGFTPLQDAVQQNNVNMARYLVEAGADVNMNDSKGYTPLHNAVLKDNIEMVEYLVEAGADVNMKDSRGYTPLHNAVLKDNIEMVRYLVEAGADVNVKNIVQKIPLKYGVDNRNQELIRYLLEQGSQQSGKTLSQYIEEVAAFLPDDYRVVS